ncbi:B12 binding protein [Flavobacteriaceae bacterium MAR_2010_72]|nr:B12 binding protein [Flavobacteriaceae bacterium MAR_2010_72]TVZ60068.1 B12 binding protein [Flavobacteriaceae bacterium MAR_2010_105]
MIKIVFLFILYSKIMNNIKTSFSIKDLENLTGIKAHTIRIWEKRYNLLEPERTDTNIRTYSLENLQKLLNVSYLNANGYKISKIATLKKEDVPSIVREIASRDNFESHAVNSFKIAMLNFDTVLFYKVYSGLSNQKSFRTIFYEVFLPLLSEIGILWQTSTITPAHEHFITTLIRQKILINIELAQQEHLNSSKKAFVLYLPENEIHELGLMFIHYELILKGHHSIFLGPSVPLDNLKEITTYYDDVTFISYFTIKPEKDHLQDYLKDFKDQIIALGTYRFWILGKMLEHLEQKKVPKGISMFNSIKNLVKEL